MVENCGQEKCVKGTLTLKQNVKGGPTTIFGVLKKVFPAGEHGWHVHEFGIRNTTEGCGSAGGHFNPFGLTHGPPEAKVRHVGDLGNLVSKGKKGVVFLKQKDRLVSLVGDADVGVVGRTIVIHGGPDDLGLGVGDAEAGSLASGNSGPRIGCCEIILKKTV
ncbi:hypothetical protein BSKO_04628 [Bryopsis sp. KO-2023]|nr:hypothetical protein BSKO_04628 [Bryopsis sp. KO-2023]